MKYLYALYCAVTFIILFLVCFPLIVLFGLFGFRKGIWLLVRVWSIFWFFIIGMYTQTSYRNKDVFKSTNGHIIVANHQSYLDVALIFRALPVMCRTLAKKELANIPLFGYLYRQMTVLVDRNSAESKKKSLQQLTKSIRQGENIFVFPEGTFNETGQTMLPFYDGAFKIAIDTQTNIIPVLFLDTDVRFNYKGFWNWSPGKNRIIILEEIDITLFAKEDVKKLKHHVFHIMSNAMHEYKPHLEKKMIEI